jgi:hypothetical protein
MTILKSFEEVFYSDKVEYKSIFLRPLPPKIPKNIDFAYLVYIIIRSEQSICTDVMICLSSY